MATAVALECSCCCHLGYEPWPYCAAHDVAHDPKTAGDGCLFDWVEFGCAHCNPATKRKESLGT